MTTRLGAQMYTVRQFTQTPEGLLESLKKVKEIGYEFVQLSAIGADIPVDFTANALRETGLKCRATHISFGEMQKDLKAVVAKHKAWECPYVGVGSMPGEYRTEGAAGYVRFAKDAGEIAKKLKDEGFTFIYHNHHFEFVKHDGKTGLEILFDNAADEMQFEIDTFWVQRGGGDPLGWIKKVQGRMDVVHFKDMKMGENLEPTITSIGNGNLNWPAIFALCNETGIKYAFVEQDVCEKDPFECLRDSFNFITPSGIK